MPLVDAPAPALQDTSTRSTAPAVGMVAPVREMCGVADYTRYLTDELRHLCDLRYVVNPDKSVTEQPSVDLVHIQHQYFLFGGVAPWKNRFARFIRSLRSPAVMTVHEFVPPSGSPLARAAIRATNRAQFRHPRVRRLIVHTETDRSKLLQACIETGRIAVVRHGVPQPPLLPPRDAARKELAIEGQTFVVTLFGFLSRRKGHPVALQALHELRGMDVKLIFAGGAHPHDRSTYAADLQAQARELGFKEQVQITGYLPPEQVASVMRATDLVIAPFTDASGSGSLAMAFACGKPILASDIPPHREYLQETPGSVALFHTGSAQDLARSIQTLIDDRDHLNALSQGAAQYAMDHTYGRMARETVELYRAVLSERD